MKKLIEKLKNINLSDFLIENRQKILIVTLVVMVMLLAVALVVVIVSDEEAVPTGITPYESETVEETEKETETKREEKVIVPYEKRSNGIDVSKWQGKIDWKKVKESGIYFAFIRIGLRGEDGMMYEDEWAAYNLREAEANGILVGVYYFSTAVNKKEAEEEADWVLDYIEGCSISYPVVYDCEGYTQETSRMYGLTAKERTDNALAFLDKISAAGYDTMHYGSRNDLENTELWDMKRIEANHKVWVALYGKVLYPYQDKPNYKGRCDAWQFTDKGNIEGIDVDVDLVVCYFVCDKAAPKAPDKQPPSVETQPADDVFHGVKFVRINDKVTAKDYVNLRAYPSTEEENIVGELKKGEFLERTAISDAGWSRLVYNGEEVYAVSSYLANEITDDGEETELQQYYFDSVRDTVTAKIETNLRTAPTTSGSEVVYTLKNGEYLTRTGINVATGWSRLDYNGETVYAISSYLVLKENNE